MMRLPLESLALIAVRNWLAGSQPTQRGRTGRNVSMTLRQLRNEFSVAG